MKLGQEFKVSSKEYFVTVLTLLNPFLNLSPLEIKVVACLLLKYNKYKQVKKGGSALSDDEIGDLILSHTHRHEIAAFADTSYYNVNNIITSLRKKDILKGKTLSKKILLPLDKELVIEFKFILNE